MATMRWDRFKPRQSAVRSIAGPTTGSGFMQGLGVSYAQIKANAVRSGQLGAEALRAKRVKITLAPVR